MLQDCKKMTAVVYLSIENPCEALPSLYSSKGLDSSPSIISKSSFISPLWAEIWIFQCCFFRQFAFSHGFDMRKHSLDAYNVFTNTRILAQFPSVVQVHTRINVAFSVVLTRLYLFLHLCFARIPCCLKTHLFFLFPCPSSWALAIDSLLEQRSFE